jgi:6-phosphogluconolactonase (cycloisomerase 2 family)
MKFGKLSQIGLVLAGSLLAATAFTACQTLTVDFLYVATTRQSPGQIEVYEVNSESGALRTIPTSPFPSGGRNPLAEAVSPDFLNFYAANNDDNNIVQFGIGNDGKLYSQSTVNTPGTFPMSLAMNSAGSYLYVVDTLQPVAGCSLSNPCPGLVAGYAVTPSKSSSSTSGSIGGSLGQTCSSTGCTLGTPVTNANGLGYEPLQLSANDATVLTPTASSITANGNYLYVTAYSASNQGYLFAFSVGSDGGLTPLPSGQTYSFNGSSTPLTPIPVGSQLSGIATDSGSQYLYITDELNNQVDTFSIASGTPSLLATAATGNRPTALTTFKDQYLYVTNSLDSTVTAYSIASGTLTKIADFATDSQPVAVIIDPRNIGYLYTVNFLGSSLSGFKINQTNGTLVNAQQTPYASSAQPTAVTGIPHSGSVEGGSLQ